jgi:O-acetyl-ADP-ribose deacetylase (regulator of RNase III)
VPSEVAKVVHSALELSPEARYPSAAAMFEAIGQLLPSGHALREEMLAPLSSRTHAAFSSTMQVDPPSQAPRIVVDPGATEPIRGDESTEHPYPVGVMAEQAHGAAKSGGRSPAPARPPSSPGRKRPPASPFHQANKQLSSPSGARLEASEKRYSVGQGEVVLTLGNIVSEFTDAIVNATDALFSGSGDVDKAIHLAAGPELRAACQDLRKALPGRRLAMGEAIATPGFRLHARHVIHCVGPSYVHDPEGAPKDLANCFRNALRICRELELRSIAFPAARGYPLSKAASVFLSVLKKDLFVHSLPKLVRIVLFDPDAFRAFVAVADRRL